MLIFTLHRYEDVNFDLTWIFFNAYPEEKLMLNKNLHLHIYRRNHCVSYIQEIHKRKYKFRFKTIFCVATKLLYRTDAINGDN